jgi:transposase InsO family protein
VVARQCQVADGNRLWGTDRTSLRTAEGWLYLAAMLDAPSRRVVGWAMADHRRGELPLEALHRAIRARRPRSGELVHHSDRGSQYTAGAAQAVLAAHGIRCSMSRKGDCYDNAMAESFFATLKRELLPGEGGQRKRRPGRRCSNGSLSTTIANATTAVSALERHSNSKLRRSKSELPNGYLSTKPG